MTTTIIGSDFINETLLLRDWSDDPLFDGKYIFLHVTNITNSNTINISDKSEGFQNTDFVADDNETYVNKINRHKGDIQMTGFNNSIWTVKGTFVWHEYNDVDDIILNWDNSPSPVGGASSIWYPTNLAYPMSPYILKVLENRPRTMYMTTREITDLKTNSTNNPRNVPGFDSAKGPLYSLKGIPVVIKNFNWNIDLKRKDGGGTYTLTLMEDKE